MTWIIASLAFCAYTFKKAQNHRGMLVEKFFPRQPENMGVTSIFLFYAGTVVVGLVILFFTLRETKGISIEEFQDSLAS